MARKPQRSAKAAPKRAPALPPPGGTDREKIIAAFMALLAEKRFEQIGFADIAERAGVTLAACRAEFGSMLGDPGRLLEGDSTARCWPAATATWPRSRRASGCSTC